MLLHAYAHQQRSSGNVVRVHEPPLTPKDPTETDLTSVTHVRPYVPVVMTI
jgi:hypothetical protein